MSATENAPSIPTVSAPATGAHQIVLYEPAMCCPTGVCGPSVDPALVTAGEDLRWAESRGATVARFNLASDPDAFVASPKITGLLQAFGEQALPALVVDGEIAVHGRYPTRDELSGVLASPADAPEQASGSCGSSGLC